MDSDSDVNWFSPCLSAKGWLIRRREGGRERREGRKEVRMKVSSFSFDSFLV